MYTKGPWKVNEHSIGKFFADIEADYDDKTVRIVAVITNYAETSESRANSRLISAAPELLEACKLLNKWLMDFSPYAVNKNYWKIVKQAIAKAEPISQEE